MKKTNLLFLVNILIIFFTTNNTLFSQTSTGRESALKIFFDCDYCDEEFIKKELTYVNYVRDSKEAQVHILFTEESSGNGGEKISIFFIGQRDFKGQNDTLSFYTKSDATNDEIREKQLHTLKLGLMRYVAKTAIASNIKITYQTEEKEEDQVKDKWNSWVFNANLNGYFNGEKSYKSNSLSTSIDASRVTPEHKFVANAYYNYNEDIYNFDDTSIVSSRNSKSFYNQYVKSINNHWSIGYTASVQSSYYSNRKLYTYLNPAIEYNIFSYEESNRKQIRFLYRVGPIYADYNDTTIYNKSSEFLFQQSLSIGTEFKQKWGSVSLSIQGSNYLHDINYNRLEIFSMLNLRILKGLSLRLYGGISFIHDQLSLPKGEATSDDILLRRRQLASQYDYWGSVGLTYTFGSIYNNVVNPRFGN
ncbi:MAG: hypothetical protein AB9846_07520 [Tenuifilaceae bacterium]